VELATPTPDPEDRTGWTARRRLVLSGLVGGLVLVLFVGSGIIGPAGHPVLAVAASISPALLVLLMAGWPKTRRLISAATTIAALANLLAVGYWQVEGTQAPAGPWPLLATLGLAVQIVLECRWSPARRAALVTPLAVLAESVLTVPITGPTTHGWLETVAVCAFWSVIGLAAVAGGLYLRGLDTARLRAVRQARRAQRVQLATDLHDFVAHDVSAMVVQVQAAQIMLAEDPDGTAGVLRRIEADGVRALTAMDRTVRLLRELEDVAGGSPTPLPDATHLPELIERYAAGSTAPATLTMDPGIDTALVPEAGVTVYRVVVEALTNVRRHGPPGAAVTVQLHRQASGVALSVTDRPGDTTDHRQANPFTDRALQREGGTGLAGLRERVEMLGGRLSFGPETPAGWHLRADLPSSALRIPSADGPHADSTGAP